MEGLYALNKCKLPQNTVLHRGVDLNAIENLLTKQHKEVIELALNSKLSSTQIAEFSESLKGIKINEKAFCSTSYDKNSAFEKDVLFNIKIPKDNNAVVIEDLSKYPEQKEVLLQRNSNFVINKVIFKNKKCILDINLIE